MKTVIITGATGHLGTSAVTAFLEKGYRVLATAGSEESKKNLRENPNLETRVVNLANESETERFIHSSIEMHGKIDAALLLAGGFAMGKIEDTTSEDLRGQISLNFETAYHIARPLFVHMMGNDYGRIVMVGSRPAIKPADGKNMIAYGLSKSLLFTLADYLNAAARGKDVTATVVVPSTLDTPPNRQSMPKANPANWVKTDVLAGIMEFIVSDTASPLRETVLKVYNNA